MSCVVVQPEDVRARAKKTDEPTEDDPAEEDEEEDDDDEAEDNKKEEEEAADKGTGDSSPDKTKAKKSDLDAEEVCLIIYCTCISVF